MSATGAISTLAIVVGASALEEPVVISSSDHCKPQILRVGWSSGAGSRSLAETKALISWTKQANQHGRNYASWHNAQNRDVICKVNYGSVAKCTVKARPCKQQPKIKFDALF